MDKSLVRRIILLLVALAMLVYTAPFACAEAPAAGGQDETVSSSGAKEEDKDKDEDKDEDEGEEGESGSEEDEEEDEEDKGDSDTPAGFVVDPALAFHGPLSSYQPRRENVIGPVWSRVTFESASDDDDDKEKLEYEATFEGGKLVRLEIEIEYEDGTEYEVVYDGNRKIISAEYETEDGEITFDGTAWHDKDGNTTEGPDLSFMGKYYDSYRIEGTWYGNNTMSLIGLSLRDMYPALTDRWYQVVPVDLTKEGVFRYATAASNIYYIGSCIVTIKDGTVTTDYTLPYGEVYPQSDCLMWFTDISEITTNFLNNPIGTFEFGKPYSIRDDLKGKEIALLFICNHITYRVPLTGNAAMPVRYLRGNIAVREQLAEFEALYARMK